MARNDQREGSPAANDPANSATPDDAITERLIDGRDASQQEIVDAAQQAFDQDQKSPDHPSRVERRAGEVEDPSHSKSSESQRR